MEESGVVAIRPVCPPPLSPFDAVYATRQDKPLLVITSGLNSRIIALVREGRCDEDHAKLSRLIPTTQLRNDME